jgi:hypothetical protein
MRGKETWLLAAAVGLVAWAMYMWAHSRFPISSVLAEYRAKSSAAFGKPPARATPSSIPKARAASNRLASAHPSEFPGGTTTVIVPPPPFPTQNNLQTGTALAKIRQIYGEPMMDVSGLKDGHLLERWYYINSDNTAMTVATMDDGFVSSVETLSRPDFGVHLKPSGS